MWYESDGLAVGMYLVMEVRTKPKVDQGTKRKAAARDGKRTKGGEEHTATYFVQQSVAQWYDAVGSHRHFHYGIQSSQLGREKQKLRNRGFEEATSADQANELHEDCRKYFIVLDKDTARHELASITVVNDVYGDPDLAAVAKSIPMAALARMVFLKEGANKKAKGKKKDPRGNRRFDIGHSNSKMMNYDVIDGMALPQRMVEASHYDGVGNDKNLEDTMFKAGCALMKMSDLVQERHGRKDMYIAGPVFRDAERNKHFGNRWACDLGHHDLVQWARFDGSSLFGAGETSECRFFHLAL
ncbi:hypothetical protein ACHAXT_004718 [Thalassiosira profunda]